MAKMREKERLKQRDGDLCSPHTGGCGLELDLEFATIDHIIPQGYCKSEGIGKYFERWNKQLAHSRCNNLKAGRVSGLPVFSCLCHYFQVESDNHLYLYYHYETDRPVAVLFRENFVLGTGRQERGRKGQKTMSLEFLVDDQSLPKDRRAFSIEHTMSVDEMPGVPQVGDRIRPRPNANRAGFFFQRINPMDVSLFNIYQRKPLRVLESEGYEYPELRNARMQSDSWHVELQDMFPPHFTPEEDLV